MQSKLIKAFFRGTLSDEIIRSPRSPEYKDIDRRETALYDKLRPNLRASSWHSSTNLSTCTASATRWKRRTITYAVSSLVSALQWNASTSPTSSAKPRPTEKPVTNKSVV